MKLEENMYVRTKKYGIHKISEIDERKSVYKYICDYRPHEDGDGTYTYSRYADKDIVKASHNIINLIEENDYVNGKKITRIIPPDVLGDEELTDKRIFSSDEEIFEDDIETVLTKEKFESEVYKVV